jgi:hypothetical protein
MDHMVMEHMDLLVSVHPVMVVMVMVVLNSIVKKGPRCIQDYMCISDDA